MYKNLMLFFFEKILRKNGSFFMFDFFTFFLKHTLPKYDESTPFFVNSIGII